MQFSGYEQPLQPIQEQEQGLTPVKGGWLTVLLATAIVRVQVGNIIIVPDCRALCDSGSQINLISWGCAKRLRVPLYQSKCNIVGIGGHGTPTNYKVILEIKPHFESENSIIADFHIVEQVAENLPHNRLPELVRPNSDMMIFADRNYYIPGSIDMLFGADIWSRMVGTSIFYLPSGAILQETIFGHIVLGQIPGDENKSIHSFRIIGQAKHAEQNGSVEQVDPNEQEAHKLDEILLRFWEMDELKSHPMRSPEEELVEQIFAKKHYRDELGRYVTHIPIRPDSAQLGSSREVARRRFMSLERKLQRNPELRERYVGFMREYEQMGHMQIVNHEPEADATVYHIPHHCVEEKFRVVFDASCKTTSGKSFNDIQMVGEKLQFDLASIIMRFRRHRIAIGADVMKMFRMVRLDRSQWNLQRIFWREDPEGPLLEYWLTVVTYGMASSLHSAVRAMVQCARDNAANYPEAARIIQEDFYVDDCLTGADSIDEALVICRELDLVLKSGGFELAKWTSNCRDVIRLMRSAENPSIDLSENSDTKVLGLRWLTTTDELTFQVTANKIPSPPSKRVVLSEIAKLYDPNGFISPIIIVAKLMMQDLWRLKIDWDEIIPAQVLVRWDEFHKQLEQLQNV